METTKKTKFAYSVFSGLLYELLEEDIKLLNEGQIPLLKQPNTNCKKCYGRYNLGRDSNNYTFIPCSCLRKVVDVDTIRGLENFRVSI